MASPQDASGSPPQPAADNSISETELLLLQQDAAEKTAEAEAAAETAEKASAARAEADEEVHKREENVKAAQEEVDAAEATLKAAHEPEAEPEAEPERDQETYDETIENAVKEDMSESSDPVGAVLMRVVAWSNEAVGSYYDVMRAEYVDSDSGQMDPDATFASLPEWARRLPEMDPVKQQLAIDLLFVLGNAAFHSWLVGSSQTDTDSTALSDDVHDMDAADGKNRARLHEFVNGMTTLIAPVIKSAEGKRRVNELRAKIVSQLRSEVANAPPGARRVRMYTSLSIWDAIDQASAVDSSQAEACRTSLEAMSNCRATRAGASKRSRCTRAASTCSHPGRTRRCAAISRPSSR